jgi:hypothetical protein
MGWEEKSLRPRNPVQVWKHRLPHGRRSTSTGHGQRVEPQLNFGNSS